MAWTPAAVCPPSNRMRTAPTAWHLLGGSALCPHRNHCGPAQPLVPCACCAAEKCGDACCPLGDDNCYDSDGNGTPDACCAKSSECPVHAWCNCKECCAPCAALLPAAQPTSDAFTARVCMRVVSDSSQLWARDGLCTSHPLWLSGSPQPILCCAGTVVPTLPAAGKKQKCCDPQTTNPYTDTNGDGQCCPKSAWGDCLAVPV